MKDGLGKHKLMGRLRKARAAHMRWRAYAQALLSGVQVTDDKIPVKHTDCAFGQWYHSLGKEELGDLDSYEGIAVPHQMLHEVYEKIYDIMHAESPTGLKSLFTNRDKLEQEKLVKARNHMNELIGISEVLLQSLDLLEQEIREQFE